VEVLDIVEIITAGTMDVPISGITSIRCRRRWDGSVAYYAAIMFSIEHG